MTRQSIGSGTLYADGKPIGEVTNVVIAYRDAVEQSVRAVADFVARASFVTAALDTDEATRRAMRERIYRAAREATPWSAYHRPEHVGTAWWDR